LILAINKDLVVKTHRAVVGMRTERSGETFKLESELVLGLDGGEEEEEGIQ
jgi:hypothetical protein